MLQPKSLKLLWLGVWLAAAILIIVGPGLIRADSPPSGQPLDLDQLEQFWQEAYGGLSIQQIDQFLATLDRELLAKAEPDECYDGEDGYGNTYPPGPPCASGVPKVNQAYVWGLAKSGPDLWFGTAPNVHCLVLGGFLGVVGPNQTDSWVCEFGESRFAQPPFSLPAQVGDWRPPYLFVYNTESKTLTEKTPLDPLIFQTSGIRSAGALDEMVILSGPSLTGGINLFAFNTTTGSYLGSTNLPAYSNIRKWRVVDGVLYTGVANATGGGSVLRWTGDAANPFQFEVVGNLDSPGVELAAHEGRLFITTWPDLGSQPPRQAGLYMSPPIPAGGLTPVQAGGWIKVWQAGDYEPDPVTAFTYGGGALASFDGYLYWGTMHVPMLSTRAHFSFYDQILQRPEPYPNTEEEIVAGLLGTYRAISIFRGQNFGTVDEEQEVLYGLPLLPTAALSGTTEVIWELTPNGMGNPRWGPSGFGNFYNNYTWTMDVFDNQLFTGSMDWSYLLSEGLEPFLELILETELEIEDIELPPPLGVGADLFRFPDSSSPAVPESIEGVGNYSNYGLRTMIADEALYLGTANPMNLLTDLEDDRPEGGWELIRLMQDAADLSITKSDLADPVGPNQTLIYEISVVNNGPSAANDVVITDTLDSDLIFVLASSACRGSSNSDQVICIIDTLPAGDSANLSIRTVTSNLAKGPVLTNTVEVSSANFDPDTRNNIYREETTVLEKGRILYLPQVIKETASLPDLVGSFSLNPDKNTYAAGEEVTITVVITNQGGTYSGPFWVDFYLNPDPPPASANVRWSDVCSLSPCYGLAWSVTGGLAPGESITLTSTEDSYAGPQTIWEGSFVPGTTDLYLYVDSWNPADPNGAVLESDETNNRAERHGLTAGSLSAAGSEPPSTPNLPPRPLPGR